METDKDFLQKLSIMNQKRSTQIGNYCYLIAGVEVLLSCKIFINFINCYLKFPREDTINLKPICGILMQYMKKEREFDLYPLIEKIVFESLDIKNYGEMEDMNVIFLYFQKSKLYCEYFDQFVYILDLKCKYTKKNKDYGIYFIRQHSPVSLIKACDVLGVFAFAIRVGNHYEVYQRYKNENGDTFFVAKNTNYLLNGRWDVLCVLCKDINRVLQNLLVGAQN